MQQPLVLDHQPLLCGLPHLHAWWELTFAEHFLHASHSIILCRPCLFSFSNRPMSWDYHGPILEVRNRRHREVKYCSQGCTVMCWRQT